MSESIHDPAELLEMQRRFCTQALPGACSQLLGFIEDARANDFAGFADEAAFIRHGLGLDPIAVAWAVAGLRMAGAEIPEAFRPKPRPACVAVETEPKPTVCAMCGKATTPGYHGSWVRKRILCSRACKQAWNRQAQAERRKAATKERQATACQACGALFHATRSDARFCSNRCRQIGFRTKRNG